MKAKLFSVLSLIFLCIPLQAESNFSLSGYYKNFAVVFNPPAVNDASISAFPDRNLGLVNNRLRLNFIYGSGRRLSFSFSYNISARIQDSLLFDEKLFMADVDLFRYRCGDLKAQLYPSEQEPQGSFGVFQNLDRAFLAVKTGPADIFIGRQPIAWGSARILSATDIIAPFTFEELDTEDRVGVDAVRLRLPLGFMAELDTGYVFGEDFKFSKSAFFLRGKFYLAKTDMALLLVGFHESLLAGLDVSRSLGGAGFWFEGAYVFVKALDDYEAGRKKNYLRATVGLDYSFSRTTYGFIEYHFSGAGASRPEDYLKNLARPELAEGAVYLMGKHYLAPGLTCQIAPLVSIAGQALINLSDPSLFIAPQLEYNIAQNIYLCAGAFIGIGKSPRSGQGSGSLPELEFQSEFGGYPNIFYSSFRIYF
jgi:hypothetical protein